MPIRSGARRRAGRSTAGSTLRHSRDEPGLPCRKTRAPDPADRRRNVVTVIGPGRRQLLRLDKLIADVEDEVLAPLTPAQRDKLTRLLTTLVNHHSRQM